MELELDRSTPFNLHHTLNCGQAFRWEKKGNWWHGIVGNNIVKIKQIRNKLICRTYPEEKDANYIRNYFRLDDDLPHILSQINKDVKIHKAIQKFYGLRIIGQDPWECLISYICATRANIPAIKRMISSLARKFGERIIFENRDLCTFPKPEALAQASLSELKGCGVGYRAKYIMKSAEMISNRKIDLHLLKRFDYKPAKKKLLSIPGVGQKVADCVLLFSLDKLEAFPVDV